ncbi:MAG: RluA family pseudouridine synthase [Eubacterium sp.]|nr:RluA family pseudouridine synthase [Eubacterium sp.]
MYELEINKSNEGQKLKKLCFRFLKDAPQSFVFKMLRKKNIVLNDKKATGEEILNSGDTVKFYFSDETIEKFTGISVSNNKADNNHDTEKNNNIKSDIIKINKYSPDKNNTVTVCGLKNLPDMNILIIYEDDDIVILNKPYGVLTQKADKKDHSLNDMLLEHLKAEGVDIGSDNSFKPSICNRLDRNTTGIVLAGKTIRGLQLLSQCIKERRIEKYYMTICVGVIEKPLYIEAYLSKDEKNNKVHIINSTDTSTGIPRYIGGIAQEKFAGRTVDTTPDKTGYSLIKTEFIPVEAKNGYTLLKVKLITGKSHQIRAQLAAIGYPVIGDTKYNPSSDKRTMKSQLLHAREIIFDKDGCGKYSGKRFICDYPGFFLKTAERLGFNL